jgi:N6-adenosine-specific RNA methylase IME4
MFIDITDTDKKYNIIYADPPWRYSDNGSAGAAENHYSTMNITDICTLPVKDLTAADCVLFLWTTYPMLQEAMTLITAWGFRYKSIAFQWLKLNKSGKGFFFGLGRWTRGNTEPCLIAIKGKPYKFVQSQSVSQIIEYPIMRHSAKPPLVRDKIIDLMGDIPRIELFARQTVAGWDCWGNEIPDESTPPLMPQYERNKDNGQLSLINFIEGSRCMFARGTGDISRPLHRNESG